MLIRNSRVCTVTLPLLSLSTYFYYFYLQQEEILNARGTTLLLGIKFENYEVLDVLLQYFAQHHGIGNFQLPMSIALFKLIKITTAEGESKLSLAIVNSTNQIRAKCDFKLEDMRSLLKDNLQQWEFVKDSKFVKEVSTVFFMNNTIGIEIVMFSF